MKEESVPSEDENGVRDHVCLVRSAREVLDGPVLGSGDWCPAPSRLLIDWALLARFLGWTHSVATVRAMERIVSTGNPYPQIWILCCHPDEITSTIADWLQHLLDREPVLVIGPPPSENSALASLARASCGSECVVPAEIAWSGPGPAQRWRSGTSRVAIGKLASHASNETWGSAGGQPVISARRLKRGSFASLGVHASSARDAAPAFTQLFKHLLTWGSPAPTSAWIDFVGTVVLRMDDPGGAQNVTLTNWIYEKLDTANWQRLGTVLSSQNARMTIAYTPAWVDAVDGGRLFLDGAELQHRERAIYPTPRVKFIDTAGACHDYADEFRGIKTLIKQRIASPEVHGYTHTHPDVATWLQAVDRYDSPRWYRDFNDVAHEYLTHIPKRRHPLVLATRLHRRLFQQASTSLVCPGNECDDDLAALALSLGFRSISNYYLAVRDGRRFLWCNHVCAPYADEACEYWLENGLPVIACFHDRDIALHGVQWLASALLLWRQSGARHFVSLSDLSALLDMRLFVEESQLTLAAPEIPGTNLELVVRCHTSTKMRVLWNGRHVHTLHFDDGIANLRLSALLENSQENLP